MTITDRSLKRAWQWLSARPLHLTWLRVYDQVARRITGAPPRRYSQITPQLHIGGQPFQHGLGHLRARGITGIVNLRNEHDDVQAGVIVPRYLHLRVTDNTAPTPDQLREGVAYIAQHIDAGGSIYIHCGVGVGRAPTLAAAYLVSTGQTPEQALATIRAVRPFIWLNQQQRASLHQLAGERA